MMTVRIKQEFRDRDDFLKVYPVGSVCKFDKERAKELVSRGLAEPFSRVEKRQERVKGND